MSLWERLAAIVGSIVDPVMQSFTPYDDATAPEIRRNGIVCFLVGTFSFIVGASLLLSSPRVGLVSAPFILIGYALIGVGAYRVLMGKSADIEHPNELNPLRVAIAVEAVCVVFVVYFLLLKLAKTLVAS